MFRLTNNRLCKRVLGNAVSRFFSTKPDILNSSNPPSPHNQESPFSHLKSVQFKKQPSLDIPLSPEYETNIRLNANKRAPTNISSLGQYNITSSVPLIHPRNRDVNITVLPNGTKVLSIENNSNVTSVSITFEDAGIAMDPAPGYSIISNKLSFADRHTDSAIDELTSDGFIDHFVKRFYISSQRSDFESSFRTLCNQIFNPSFSQGDLDAVIQNINQSIDEAYSNPAQSELLEDFIREACFGKDQSAGRPILARIENEIHMDDIKDYIRRIQRVDKAIVVGLGVEHDRLLDLVTKYLRNDNPGEPIKPMYDPKNNVWRGGEVFHQFSGEAVDLYRQNIPTIHSYSLAFHAPHVNQMTLPVLLCILGGGRSFSAGGPGKGLLSVINTDIIARYPVYFASANHFDSRIFSLTVGATNEYAQASLYALVELCKNLMERIQVEDFERGKQRAKFLSFTIVENPRLLHEYFVHMLIHEPDKTNFGFDTIQGEIDKVTLQDVRELWQNMITQPFGLVGVGDPENFPSYDLIERIIRDIAENNKRYL